MLLGNRRVAVHPAPAISGGQGPPEAVLRRLSLEHPAAGPGESPVVREPQNVERAGWWESVTVLPRAPTTSRSAERDQTTLRRVHRETKAPEAFRQHVPHPVGVRFLLEDNDHVVRIADEDASATETRLHLGGDSRPTTPVSPTPLSPQPQIPNVAGTYQGPLTITAALAGGAVMVSLSGTRHITVVQAGAQLTITGAIAIFDETSALDTVTGTVDNTGRVTFPPDSIINAAPIPMGDDTCGTITPAPTMLTFSGNTADSPARAGPPWRRWSAGEDGQHGSDTADSPTCRAPVAAPPAALVLPGGWQIEGLPDIVRRAGPQAAERTVEFFTAQIRNPHTRAAYGTAVTRFFTWCDARGLELAQISPIAVATYIEEMQGQYRAPTIKQHLAAIRRLFDWLVIGQVVPANPAASVRGPTHVVRTGKTPVLQPAEARLLLDTIDTSTLPGLRDRALLGVMVYSFARVSAIVGMRVEDYYQQGKRWWLRLQEKGGKHHAVPVHHKAEAYLDAYLAAAGIAAEKDAPLWRSMPRAGGMGARRMSRVDVFRMIKRRVKTVGLGEANCHTFRATGITAYLLNGGTLERAQAIAAHESPRTTKLYDRTADEVTIEDIEKIGI